MTWFPQQTFHKLTIDRIVKWDCQAYTTPQRVFFITFFIAWLLRVYMYVSRVSLAIEYHRKIKKLQARIFSEFFFPH